MKIDQFNKKDLLTIPNIITYFRMACIPVFIALSVLAGCRQNLNFAYGALGVFAIAAASDLVDGYLARKYNWGSGVGMLLDPLADKMMHIAMVICLCFAIQINGEYFLHWGFLVAIAAKELFMIAMSPIVAKKGIVVKANMLGKVGSATLSLAIIMCFFHNYFIPSAGVWTGFMPYYWDWAFVTVAVIQSYFALFSYVKSIAAQLILIVKKEKVAKKAAKNGEVVEDKEGIENTNTTKENEIEDKKEEKVVEDATGNKENTAK